MYRTVCFSIHLILIKLLLSACAGDWGYTNEPEKPVPADPELTI